MSIAIGTDSVADVLYNKSLGLSTAYPGDVTKSQLEFGDATPYVTVDKLMSQIIPDQVLVMDTVLTAPSGVTSCSSNALYGHILYYTNVTMISDPPLKNNISFMYQDWQNNNILKGSIKNPKYKYTVKISGIPENSSPVGYHWNFDADLGVLTFFGTKLPNGPVTMDVYKYNGTYGISSNLQEITSGTGNVTTNHVTFGDITTGFINNLNINQNSLGSISIGDQIDKINSKNYSISIGNNAGIINQGFTSIAIGFTAGYMNQHDYTVSTGYGAGSTEQGERSIAIGINAGNDTQGQKCIAIGNLAGLSHQGDNAIAIGSVAGITSQHSNTIILNASSQPLDSTQSDSLFIKPIRQNQGEYQSHFLSKIDETGEIIDTRSMYYDPTAKTVYISNLYVIGTQTTGSSVDTSINNQFFQISENSEAVDKGYILGGVSSNIFIGTISNEPNILRIASSTSNLLVDRFPLVDTIDVQANKFRGDGSLLTNNKVLLLDTISTDTITYIPFATSNTGNQSLYTRANLKFNPGTGTLTSTSFNSTSDINKKQNVKNLELSQARDLIHNLKPVEYAFKTDPSKKRFGFIAQEVQETFGDSLGLQTDGTSVAYQELIAPLVLLVKSLENRIKILEESSTHVV